jgi:hypothetical protein
MAQFAAFIFVTHYDFGAAVAASWHIGSYFFIAPVADVASRTRRCRRRRLDALGLTGRVWVIVHRGSGVAQRER